MLPDSERTPGDELLGASPVGGSDETPLVSREELEANGSIKAGGQQEASDPKEDEEEPRRRRRGSFAEALGLVLTALILALSLKTYVAEAYEIKGASMYPTFSNGERVVVLKTFYEVERGDIIIFESTTSPGKDLIKRVVGLPGETVKVENGEVFVDGVMLEEGYLNDDGRLGAGAEYTVKTNEYFVLGDNRGDSHDSRQFFGVPVENLKGKVVVRWWPLRELRSF